MSFLKNETEKFTTVQEHKLSFSVKVLFLKNEFAFFFFQLWEKC